MTRLSSSSLARRKFLKKFSLFSFSGFMQWLWPFKASAGGFISFAFVKKNVVVPSVTYVDDVFATSLYTGNSSTQTIVNGINLSSNGGLVWFKTRDVGVANYLVDSTRGLTQVFSTNSTSASAATGIHLTTYNSNGYNLGSGGGGNENISPRLMCSWTFRKAAKFFDIVTYSGDANASRTISHSLGVKPGLIVLKRLDTAADIIVWSRINDLTYARRGGTGTPFGFTSTNSAVAEAAASVVNAATDTIFYPGNITGGNIIGANETGGTYLAYIFAHDSSANGLIQCGSFTTDSSGLATVTIGWEPQWILVKQSSGTSNWVIYDTMRSWSYSATDNGLMPNLSNVETAGGGIGGNDFGNPLPTGFNVKGLNVSATYIYMVIRRPNKPPTTSTDVFDAVTYSANTTARKITSLVPYVDLVFHVSRSTIGKYIMDRVRGNAPYFCSTDSFAQNEGTTYTGFDVMNGVLLNTVNFNDSGNWVSYHFKRAPGVFDIASYTGNNATSNTYNHTLGVAPEMMIVKIRTTGGNFVVYHKALGNTQYLIMNSDSMAYAFQHWANTDPTSSVFSIGYNASNYLNISANIYMNYLFATKAGISKVGSYTGTASGSVVVDCGFGAKTAKFVLIKRTDNTGNWLVVDSLRGSNYYSVWNTAAAEVNTSIVTFTAGGFTTAATGAVSNAASGANYIYLAFA